MPIAAIAGVISTLAMAAASGAQTYATIAGSGGGTVVGGGGDGYMLTPQESRYQELQLDLAAQATLEQTQAATREANIAYEQQQTGHTIMLYLAIGILAAVAYTFLRRKKILNL